MRRVFITGSTDGLGLAAAKALMAQGHEVVFHARSQERVASLPELPGRPLGVVIGDLASMTETRSIARQVNDIGRMDAIIHNAGIYRQSNRSPTAEGHAGIFAVNVLAPYVLTALVVRPARLIYLSSGMHRSGGTILDDIDWNTRRWSAQAAYSESKLYVATLAAGIARRWPEVRSNSVDPGWVPTKMGGAGAPDNLEEGHLTQTWLAVSDDSDARVSGRYWYHRQQQSALEPVYDPAFQDALLAKLAEMSGVELA